MHEEIEEEYQQFLHDINECSLVFGKYFAEHDYEDEYSHNQIDVAMGSLFHKIRDYLSKNKPNKYIVTNDWAIFVMTEDEARKRNVSERTIELRLCK